MPPASFTSDNTFSSAADDTDPWVMLSGQWVRHLRARNVAPNTITAYQVSMNHLIRWAKSEGKDSPTDLDKRDMEAFFAARFASKTRLGKAPAPSSVAMDFRHLKVFFTWLEEVEDIPNAMRKVSAPMVPETPVPVFDVDDLKKLLNACKGKDFAARRDTAILRVLFDTGIRRAELAGITMDDIDVNGQMIRVMGKGRRERIVPYGAKTAIAIDAYLRKRVQHRDRKLPNLWLAAKPNYGPMTANGIRHMLKRRAADAKISERVFAHRFRHTAAHMRLEAGLSEGDAMRIFGWKSRAMVDRYGASAADARAIKAARKSSPADEV